MPEDLQPPPTGRLLRLCLFTLRNSAAPLFVLVLLGTGLLVAGELLSEPDTAEGGNAVEAFSPDDQRASNPGGAALERRDRTLLVAGGWLLGVSLVLLVRLPWLALGIQVKLASDGALQVRSVEKPETPTSGKEGDDELAKAVAGFLALGFECAGWHSLGDFEGTVLGAWQHPEHATSGYILYYPGAGLVRLRFARRFDSGAILVSTTRLADQAYDVPPGLFVQRKKACVAELWAWHLEAEALFPPQPGEAERPALSPLGLSLAFRRRVARFHRTYTLWFLRYELVCELTRAARLADVSVQLQRERGWIPDPALYQGDGDEDSDPPT